MLIEKYTGKTPVWKMSRAAQVLDRTSQSDLFNNNPYYAQLMATLGGKGSRDRSPR
jgi:hypothetical protein